MSKAQEMPGRQAGRQARHARRLGSRQEMLGRQFVDLIMARKCGTAAASKPGKQARQ